MMKKVLMICTMLLTMLAGVAYGTNNSKEMEEKVTNKAEKILFICGSPNRGGNTVALAKVLLEGKEYETLYLTDYRINFFGQTLDGDQFEEVYKKMQEADVVVMGSPVYWHNICASVRTLMERFYDFADETSFKGKRLFFLYQGAAPTKMMIDDGEYTMGRFARIYGFDYKGMATNQSEAKQLRTKW